VYKQADLANSLAIFYYNGLRWLKVDTQINAEKQIARTTFKLAGKYQLRLSALPTEFVFYNVMPKIITPNNDGQNDRLLFNYANPQNIGVTIKVFDIEGMLVKDLGSRNDTSDIPGSYIYWDGTDQNGRTVPPGAYIYQLDTTTGKIINGTCVIAR
jgi:gliding motility-associated-like protein